MAGCYHGRIEHHVKMDQIENGQAKLENCIYAFVRGYSREGRKNPISTKQVEKHFAVQDEKFFNNCIDNLLHEKRIIIFGRSLRSSRLAHGSYVYEAVRPTTINKG
jgi:hypothetical protein